jgi:CheY-like chemotaxis protein
MLLVEDSPDDRDLVIRALRRNNFSNPVDLASDGQEAIDQLFAADGFLDRTGSKVVLLDLKLPKVDGLEVLRQIRSDPRGRRIPVVMLTSSQEESDLVASYETGASSFIVKPVDFENFSRCVADIGMYWLLTNKSPS